MPVLARLQCQYCSRFVLPSEVITFPGGVLRCLQCQDKWEAATAQLPRTRHCQDCQADFMTMDVPLQWLVWKDGTAQILCTACRNKYVPKRRDLYGGTPYGARKGLN